MENAVSSFFNNQNKEDPTTNFEWEYVLVDNDKIVNAWCMPGGKIAVYTGLLKVTKNTNALSTECLATACAISCPITIDKASIFLVIFSNPV